MKHFWLKFVIEEALGVAEAFIASGKLSPAQKAAAEKMLADGQAFVATL